VQWVLQLCRAVIRSAASMAVERGITSSTVGYGLVWHVPLGMWRALVGNISVVRSAVMRTIGHQTTSSIAGWVLLGKHCPTRHHWLLWIGALNCWSRMWEHLCRMYVL
jgi:hypothetical protein